MINLRAKKLYKSFIICLSLVFLFISATFIFCFYLINIHNPNIAREATEVQDYLSTSVLNSSDYENDLKEASTLLSNAHKSELSSQTIDSSKNDQIVTFKYKTDFWKIDLKKLEVHSNIHTIEEHASKFNRHKSLKEKVEMVESLTEITSIENAFNIVFWNLNSKINPILAKINKKPIDAQIKFNLESETFTTTKEAMGYYIDKSDIYTQLLKALKSNNTTKEIVLKPTILKPKFTQEQLNRTGYVRCIFGTNFLNSSTDRRHNIALAASKFNGLRLNPGEVLSFNNITGKRTESNGYREAKIINDGIFTSGIGGGVCQVSTTLFNAAALSGLEIIEARSHSMPVAYVEKGMDAMVNEGTSDLRIKNGFSSPVFFKTEIIDSNLIFKVFGENLDGASYLLETEILETTPPLETKVIIDTEKQYLNFVRFKGERAKIHEGTNGYKTKTTITKFLGEKIVYKKTIRRDTYKPSATIIVEGAE